MHSSIVRMLTHSGFIVYMPTNAFGPLYIHIYIISSLYLCFIEPRSLVAVSLDLCFCLPFLSAFRVFLL